MLMCFSSNYSKAQKLFFNSFSLSSCKVCPLSLLATDVGGDVVNKELLPGVSFSSNDCRSPYPRIRGHSLRSEYIFQINVRRVPPGVIFHVPD